ncbi:cytochrome C [Fibrella aquatilis]|uniref:Cytochrome C n=1 Tax=Fibrella aquatilis TaxID=2817059 RepID=A0A939G7J8_9BACT|nr:cytochrome C [Fibrella aquatilis]MBO0931830.1 cytochrome C [Fibrella aquatilis]
MSKQLQKVILFMDDNTVPFAEYAPPIKIDIDTTRLVDGEHMLKVVALSSDGKEGIQQVAFTVRNGPAISVIGLQSGDTVSDVIPITINAYGSETNESFVISASETPKPISAWVWSVVLVFIAWGTYYLISYFH